MLVRAHEDKQDPAGFKNPAAPHERRGAAARPRRINRAASNEDLSAGVERRLVLVANVAGRRHGAAFLDRRALADHFDPIWRDAAGRPEDSHPDHSCP